MSIHYLSRAMLDAGGNGEDMGGRETSYRVMGITLGKISRTLIKTQIVTLKNKSII